MLYLPPLRRLLLPSLLCLAFILYYKSTVRLPTARQQLGQLLVREPDLTPPGTRVSVSELQDDGQLVVANISENYRSPPTHMYYYYNEPGATYENGTEIKLLYADPASNPHMQTLYQCPNLANPVTDHIRLPYPAYNISVVFKNETENEKKGYLNPAIISLPYWSQNQYLLVARVTTDGSHQHNVLCEANICYTGNADDARFGEKPCTEEDLTLLGGKLGMRCATAPITLNVPPTPAESCGKDAGVLMDIPGFHDPRVFWSTKGEPLMMVNSQSRYACFGLWVIDLRQLHQPLDVLLESDPHQPGISPLMSYPSLTEITRNPRNTRGKIEKNWMFFGSKETGSYVHYDMGSQKRTFAKLVGGGITTVNLTDPREMPCLEDANNPNEEGSWHQGTNSLRMVLCKRSDKSCRPTSENQVHFALIHHKHKGGFGLPIRYERYMIVWSAHPPFSMLGISRHPIQMYNETAEPFTAEENWLDDPEQEAILDNGGEGKGMWGVFTYTVSIAWAWGRQGDTTEEKSFGYLDDEVILGIGLDDESVMFSRVPAQELLQCLRACPGRAPSPLYVSPADEGVNRPVLGDIKGADKAKEDETVEEAAEAAEAAAEMIQQANPSEGSENPEASAIIEVENAIEEGRKALSMAPVETLDAQNISSSTWIPPTDTPVPSSWISSKSSPASSVTARSA